MTDTIQAQVAALHKNGLRPKEIAMQLNLDRSQVYRALHWLRHRSQVLAGLKAYGAKRYGTKEYREYNRDRVRWRYHADPAFRRRRIDAAKRYAARNKEARAVQ